MFEVVSFGLKAFSTLLKVSHVHLKDYLNLLWMSSECSLILQLVVLTNLGFHLVILHSSQGSLVLVFSRFPQAFARKSLTIQLDLIVQWKSSESHHLVSQSPLL